MTATIAPTTKERHRAAPPVVPMMLLACPAPFVYMNEAHNSWVVIGEGSGIDPHGQGTAAEQSYCNAFR
jgi:hypothetical protein